MSRALAIDRVTPEQLAEEIGCSPRHVRKLARGLGACRVFGKTMFLMPDDVQAILEASRPCPSRSTSEAKSGTIGAPLPSGDYADLQDLLTKKKRSSSPRASSTKPGIVIPMGRKAR